jgi:hypothetical protein
MDYPSIGEDKQPSDLKRKGKLGGGGGREEEREREREFRGRERFP